MQNHLSRLQIFYAQKFDGDFLKISHLSSSEIYSNVPVTYSAF